MRNPFLTTGSLNAPLRLESCQRIHYAALRLASRRRVSSPLVPDSVPLTELRQAAKLHGPAIYLLHPSDIERIFDGVTTAVFQAVKRLYCDRLDRSIRMVWRIMDEMFRQAGGSSIEYEAVWAICLYLDEPRQASVEVTVEQTASTWRIAQITPDVHIQDISRPSIVCVLDTNPPRILAFRLADGEAADESISLAIYDAIASQRRPARDGAAGLIWQLPARLEIESDLPQNCREACDQVGIGIEQTDTASDLLDVLRGEWTQDLAGRTFTQDHFVALFDNYLERIHGYGPLRAQERLAYEFNYLIGFNRDPTWQFPALRDFLPSYEGVIKEDGVEFDGLHYEHPLLSHWLGREVMLRRSEIAEALTWIYLDGEILCQARARELRRRDGTYRLNRPRR